jgi:hypothetical protein
LAGHEQIDRSGEAQDHLHTAAERAHQVLELAERLAEHGGRGLLGRSRDG